MECWFTVNLRDEDGILLWLKHVWDTRPGALLKKSLLVWDQFSAHKTDKVKARLKLLKTTQAVIPGGLTSMLQPLDVVLNKPFKDRMRQKWMAWMCTDDKELTKGGNLKRPRLSMVRRIIIRRRRRHLWQDSGESSSEDEEPEETWDTDERLTQQELEDLFGESDDEDFGFV